MIQKAFENAAVGHTQSKEWFRLFKDDRTSVESDECSGRPHMSTDQLMIDKLHSARLENRGITVGSVMSWGSHLVWYSPF
jgi:hypothetical protein